MNIGKKGFTLIEIFIAIIIVGLLIIVFTNLMLSSFRANEQSYLLNRAMNWGQVVLETIKSQDKAFFDNNVGMGWSYQDFSQLNLVTLLNEEFSEFNQVFNETQIDFLIEDREVLLSKTVTVYEVRVTVQWYEKEELKETSISTLVFKSE